MAMASKGKTQFIILLGTGAGLPGITSTHLTSPDLVCARRGEGKLIKSITPGFIIIAPSCSSTNFVIKVHRVFSRVSLTLWLLN